MALLIVLLLATVEESIFRAVVLRYLRSDDSLLVTVGAVGCFVGYFFRIAHHRVEQRLAPDDRQGCAVDRAIHHRPFARNDLCGHRLARLLDRGALRAARIQVILIRTHVVSVVPDGLVADDIRSAPLAWLAFLLAILAMILWRRRLHEAFSVETAVCPDGDGEFKLPARSPARDAPLGAPP